MSKDGNGFTGATFRFFEELAEHNERAWFQANRDTYEEYVRTPFAELLEELGGRLIGTRMPVRGGAQTMFRINRDVRFSADKRPYAESVSGLLTESGTKDESGRLLYLALDASGGRVGAGLHQPTAAVLRPIRQRMIDRPDEVDRMLEALAGADVTIDRSEQVATMPRGFGDSETAVHADLVRCTRLVAMRPLPRSCWLDDTVLDRSVEAAVALVELYDFIDRAREDD